MEIYLTVEEIKKIEQSQYFAELFMNYDGENVQKQHSNYSLGMKAVLFPETLTVKQAFIVSFIIERMQNSGYGDMCRLENIRNNIISKLK